MPSLAVTLAFVRACGGDTGLWECRRHKLRGTTEQAPAVATGWVEPF